jgi:hypothetical protein
MARSPGGERLKRRLVGMWIGLAKRGQQAVGLGVAAIVVLAFSGLFLSHSIPGPNRTMPTPTAGQFADDAPSVAPTQAPTTPSVNEPTVTSTVTELGTPDTAPTPTPTHSLLTVTGVSHRSGHPDLQRCVQ